ncbi:MAG: PcfB family protein [Oscillospiraceae bacterium]|nr:PcfB family protein [Oscillospiraceae bacterium]
MPSDYEQGVRKTIDLTVRAQQMTSEILSACMREFLEKEARKKGKMSFGDLNQKYGNNLENISISDNNIRDFLSVARKYDVDFALKADKTTSPQTWHVFFSANRTEDFKKAFTEYADLKQHSGKNHDRGEFSREKMQKEAQEVAAQQRKEKVRERSREASR